jgi:hypothetical protein
MAVDFSFRRRAVATISNKVGCYILCDLDQVPIYVGQSVDGIRARVRRHLTSARSDIIANRQIDVWEIAWVWTYEVDRENIPELEALLFHWFNKQSTLMNGSVPKLPSLNTAPPEPSQIVQIMRSEEIAEKRQAVLRLPRQAGHYSQIIGHFLAVKNSKQIAMSMQAHFERLTKYHRELLGLVDPYAED